DHRALAYVRDLDKDVSPAAGVSDDVLVVAAAGQDFLPVRDPLDRLQLVAIARRILEIQPARRRVHPFVQLADEEVGASLHEQRHLVDARLVVLGADTALAWTRAPLDVEVQAHLALFDNAVRTRSELQ